MSQDDTRHSRWRATTLVLVIGLVAVVTVSVLLWQRSLRTAPGDIALVMTATAALLGAIAWPAAAVMTAMMFPAEIKSLAERVREVLGVKLDPPSLQQRPAPPDPDLSKVMSSTTDAGPVPDGVRETAGPYTPAADDLQSQDSIKPDAADSDTAAAAPQADEAKVAPSEALQKIRRTLRTSSEVTAAEEAILKNEQIRAVADHERAEAVTILAATIFVSMQWQRIDLTIWGSQLRALEALNGAPGGLPEHALVSRYYEPAAAKSQLTRAIGGPKWLSYLMRSKLAEMADGTVTINGRGRDYLEWRVRTRRPVIEAN